MRIFLRSTIAGLVGTLLVLTAQAANGPNPTSPDATTKAELPAEAALSLRLAPASSPLSSLLEGLAALLTGGLLLIGASRISRDDATH
jgi:hypothetical protein